MREYCDISKSYEGVLRCGIRPTFRRNLLPAYSGSRISQAGNQQAVFLSACLVGLLFNLGNANSKLLRNVSEVCLPLAYCWLLDWLSLQTRRWKQYVSPKHW
jgi:hypothetical protein